MQYQAGSFNAVADQCMVTANWLISPEHLKQEKQLVWQFSSPFSLTWRKNYGRLLGLIVLNLALKVIMHFCVENHSIIERLHHSTYGEHGILLR